MDDTLLEGAALPDLIPLLSSFSAAVTLNKSFPALFSDQSLASRVFLITPSPLFSACGHISKVFANYPLLQLHGAERWHRATFCTASSPHMLITSPMLQPCKFSRRESCREACGFSLAVTTLFLLRQQAAQAGHQGLRRSTDWKQAAFGDFPARPHVLCSLT